MDDASKEYQTGSSDGRAQEQKEWARIRKLEAENVELRTRLELARIAYEKLINYRNHNVLNFQLEKADDFIRMIRDAVTPPEAGEVP